MQLKRYTIASLILMLLVGLAVYSINKESVSFDLLGMHFPNLPIAFWVVVPVALLYLASILHMAVYALVGNFKLRRLNRDHEKMVDALRDSLLGVPDRNYVYKTDAYKLMGKLIDNSLILPYEKLRDIGNEKIDEALALLRDVKENKKVEIKKFHLANTTSLMIQNNLNRFERGEMSADEVLARPETYGDIVCAKAYESYVKTASVGSVLKYKNLLTKSSLYTFLQRINSDENGIEMSNDDVIALLKTLKLTTNDFIDLSIVLSKNMIPEQRIRLFETMSEQCDDVMEAYFYTLYDLQMIDTANEILNNTSHDEYQIFKAYRDLKRANKHYDIAIFFRRNCD
ncbi:MAG TPA: hypothetical protein VFX57_04605 [Sulfuricurvum sp.]|nr:hypothetical protein [Sulfuricurvum sp.]